MEAANLQYTGHPLVDVGLATIVVFAEKTSIDQVTIDDLLKMAAYIEDRYKSGGSVKVRTFLMTNYLNSVFTNPSLSNPKYDVRKAEYADQVLRAFLKETSSDKGHCSYCQMRAVRRATRTQVPLLNGDRIINFSPRGQPGIPICGVCLLAIHAYALGSIRSAGRVLAIHCDNAAATEYFARAAIQENLRSIQMLESGATGDMPGRPYPKTRLVEAIRAYQSQAERRRIHSLSAYHLTNYGPGADITIFELPSVTIDFLREAEHPNSPAHPAWRFYTRRGWVVLRRHDEEEGTVNLRNALYDDLFDLPLNGGSFIQRHLTPSGRDVEAWQALPEGNWALVELFLRKVITMKTERIDAIRTLGDRFAAYIQRRDRRLFNELHFARRYDELRFALVRASRDGWSPDETPLLPLNTFVTIFEEGENEFADFSWRLARDMLMIRICERLHETGWFSTNKDLIEEAELESEQT